MLVLIKLAKLTYCVRGWVDNWGGFSGLIEEEGGVNDELAMDSVMWRTAE